MPKGIYDRSNWKMTAEARARAVETQRGSLRPTTTGSKHPNAVLVEADVVVIRKMAESGWSMRQLSSHFNTCKSNIG